ncbi:alcohol dehydrogenase GroES-like domain-containing protein [Paramyrothecium foliicola]|nr:alcohol dehydrogenase GroES-like domain-containing protein [Paramyrothecium foliicola]
MGSIAAAFTPPTTQKAVVVNGKDEVVIWDAAPCPTIPSDQVMVRVEAVGLNPSDTKMRGAFATKFGILGADFAGTVVATGQDVSHLAVGDRVFGAQNEMYGTTPERGAFCEFAVTRGRMWAKIPDSWSTEAAASLPVGVSTAGIAMKLLGLPLPGEEPAKPSHVLVYGASTATATIAMQMLKLSGLSPIAICSPKNFDLAKKNLAEEVFDRHDKELAQKIKSYTKGNLRYALDCITTVESTALCYAAIGRGGGKYVSLDPWQEHVASRKVVTADFTVGPRIFGEGCTWPEPYRSDPSEDMRVFGISVWETVEKLIQDNKLQHHPLRVLDGGFEAILAGMDMVRNKVLSGEKIVKSPSRAILCVHGGGASPEIFRFQLARFRAALKDDFEFVYATGPHVAVPGPDVLPFFAGMKSFYSWFRKGARNTDEEVAVFNEAIKTTVEDWDRENPNVMIVGVLGFSQGGLASTVLLWEQEMELVPWLPRLEFGVLICCAYSDVATEYIRGMSKGAKITRISVPSLHLHGSQDCNLGQARDTLATHYSHGAARVINFEGGHHIPQKYEDVQKMASQIRQMIK